MFFKRGQGSAVHTLGPTGHGIFLLSVTENNVLPRILPISKAGKFDEKPASGHIQKGTEVLPYENFYVRLC